VKIDTCRYINFVALLAVTTICLRASSTQRYYSPNTVDPVGDAIVEKMERDFAKKANQGGAVAKQNHIDLIADEEINQEMMNEAQKRQAVAERKRRIIAIRRQEHLARDEQNRREYQAKVEMEKLVGEINYARVFVQREEQKDFDKLRNLDGTMNAFLDRNRPFRENGIHGFFDVAGNKNGRFSLVSLNEPPLGKFVADHVDDFIKKGGVLVVDRHNKHAELRFIMTLRDWIGSDLNLFDKIPSSSYDNINMVNIHVPLEGARKDGHLSVVKVPSLDLLFCELTWRNVPQVDPLHLEDSSSNSASSSLVLSKNSTTSDLSSPLPLPSWSLPRR
jgi:hypothetical protein